MKKVVKSIIGISVGILIFIFVCNKLNYLYVTYVPWHRILFHSYYEQEKIDNVFLGSSHVYCDVNPGMLDEINHSKNFNMSTGGQRWDDTYYLLREVIDDHDIKNVYLECYFWNMTEYEIWSESDDKYIVADYIEAPENYTRPWLITYEMKPSMNKIAMNLCSSDKEHMMETIFPFVRYRANTFNWDVAQKNIDDKSSEDFLNYRFHQDQKDVDGSDWYVEYWDKGFYYSNGTILEQEKIFAQNRDCSKYGIGKVSENYLRKTIDLCQQKGINVKLFISPIYDIQLLSTENYDNFLDQLKKISNEYGIELYDFNLIKTEYLDIKDGKYFMDIGHLNGDGAELYTGVLWNVLSSTLEENQELFWDSYQEKLSMSKPEIYGVYYKDIDVGEIVNADGSPTYKTRHYVIAASRNMEYRITRTISDGDNETEDIKEVVQEFSSMNEFDLPIYERGELTIEGKYEGDIFEITINY